jgi:hypothetical protein
MSKYVIDKIKMLKILHIANTVCIGTLIFGIYEIITYVTYRKNIRQQCAIERDIFNKNSDCDCEQLKCFDTYVKCIDNYKKINE